MSDPEFEDLSDSDGREDAPHFYPVDLDYSLKILREIISHLPNPNSSSYNADMLCHPDPGQLAYWDETPHGPGNVLHERVAFTHHVGIIDMDFGDPQLSNFIEIRYGTKLEGDKLLLVGMLYHTNFDDDVSFTNFDYHHDKNQWIDDDYEGELLLDFSYYIHRDKELSLVTFLILALGVPFHVAFDVTTSMHSLRKNRDSKFYL